MTAPTLYGMIFRRVSAYSFLISLDFRFFVRQLHIFTKGAYSFHKILCHFLTDVLYWFKRGSDRFSILFQ